MPEPAGCAIVFARDPVVSVDQVLVDGTDVTFTFQRICLPTGDVRKPPEISDAEWNRMIDVAIEDARRRRFH